MTDLETLKDLGVHHGKDNHLLERANVVVQAANVLKGGCPENWQPCEQRAAPARQSTGLRRGSLVHRHGLDIGATVAGPPLASANAVPQNLTRHGKECECVWSDGWRGGSARQLTLASGPALSMLAGSICILAFCMLRFLRDCVAGGIRDGVEG